MKTIQRIAVGLAFTIPTYLIIMLLNEFILKITIPDLMTGWICGSVYMATIQLWDEYLIKNKQP